jgi:hypothetical protein
MPIEAQTVEYNYTGDGVSVAFSFPSLFFASTDIIVGLDGVLQNSGFTVSGAGVPAGGNVTFATPPSVGAKVTLLRKPQSNQLIDFVSGQTVLEGVLDKGLDKLTMLVQYLLRAQDRSAHVGELSGLNGPLLPAASTGKMLLWAADGSLENSGLTYSALEQIDASAAAASAAASATLAASYATANYATRAAAIAATVPAPILAIYVRGHTTEGIGGAWYKEITNAGYLFPSQIQTNGGTRRFQIYIEDGDVTLEQFGATGGADDTSAFENAYDFACSVKASILLLGNTYTITSLDTGGPTPANRVINRLSTPPGSPAVNDAYVVGSAPTGAWVGQTDKKAVWGGATWAFTSFTSGDFVGFTVDNHIEKWTGAAWILQQAFNGHRNCRIYSRSLDTRGNAFRSATIKQKNATVSKPLIRALGGDAPHTHFDGIIFNGNDAQQSTANEIIKAEDDLVTAYPYGVMLYKCQFLNSRGIGVYLGRARGFNILDECTFYLCGVATGSDGLVINTFDTIVTRCHINGSGGSGILVDNSSYVVICATDTFLNQNYGLKVTANCADFVFDDGSIDHNLRYGAEVAPYAAAATYPAKRRISNTKFNGNSYGFNNGFPDLSVLAGVNDLFLTACVFPGTLTANKPSYAILFADTSTFVSAANCAIAANASFGTSASNALQCIKGHMPDGFEPRLKSDATGVDYYAVGAPALRVQNPASATSYWVMSGDTAGNPFILPNGAAANINGTIRPKGTGTLTLGGGSQNRVIMSDTGLAFFGTSPIAKPAVTGSRGGNAALASLLTQLAALGLITDSSTA